MTAAAWLDAVCAATPELSRGARADLPASPRSIVVIGGSGAGKTTVVDAVRAAALPGVAVPERRVTRPSRPDDHPAEAVPRDAATFAAEVAAGALGLCWQRTLGARRERYGFVATPAELLAVYSANLALVAPDAGVTPASALDGALIVVVTAPSSVRTARVRARSPGLAADALASRDREEVPPGHVELDNRGDARAAGAALVALVRAVVAVRGS